MAFTNGTVYARIGAFGNLQSYGGAATNINCLDDMTFSTGKYIYGERIYLDYIIKNPTASWLKIQNLSDDEGVLFQTKRTGLAYGDIQIINNEINCFTGGTTSLRRLYINLLSEVQVQNLFVKSLESNVLGDVISFNSDLVASGNTQNVTCKYLFNTSSGGDLLIASNMILNTSINLQTRVTGYSYNNIKVYGNSLYSSYNGTTNTPICVYPSIVNCSDERVKHKIKPLENGLELLSQLKIKSYLKTMDFKVSYDASGNINEQNWREYGMVAQDILETDLSFAVNIPMDVETQPYTLNYDYVFVANLKATQELHDIVKNQQIEIDALKEQVKRIDDLEDVINMLLAKV